MGGGRVGGWGYGKFSDKFSREFRGNFAEISAKCLVIRKREIHIVTRQNNISINGLWENNSTIMPDSLVEYLRKFKLDQIRRFLTTTR